VSLTKNKLLFLGQYVIDSIENPENEIDFESEILAGLKEEVVFTRRYNGDIPQDNPDLNRIVSFFDRQKKVVNEVVERPHVKLDIDFTIKFIASNQNRINKILNAK